jgi:hypothetical protein
MKQHWKKAFERVMRGLDELIAGRPVAIRLVGTQNIFLSDPTIITDYGLPEDFARQGGELLIRELRDEICAAAKRHGAACVDIWTLFSGPQHDQPWDENSAKAHQDVAGAILATGLEPLDIG